MIVILNSIAALIFLSAAAILFLRYKKSRLSSGEVIPLLASVLLYVLVTASNILEHTGYTSYFDPTEDIAEVLFTLLFLLFVHNWRQRRTIETIQEQETWLRQTLESIVDGIMTTDAKGKITYINRAMSNLTGYTLETAIGKKASLLLKFLESKTGHPVEYDPFFLALSNEPVPSKPEGIFLRKKNGSIVSVSENTSAIRNSSENPLGAVGIFRDMTEYDAIVEQLTHVHKMEALGQLAGGVAHDLNNMLAGIMGAVDLIHSRLSPHELEKYGQLSQLILDSSERAADLTTNLLAFSRKGKILSTPVSLKDALVCAIAIAERTMKKTVSILHEIPDNNLSVVGDPAQLQNAILNLILNARDAMDGNGTIRISLSTCHLDRAFCDNSEFAIDPGEYTSLYVSDTGSGIPYEIQKRIFEPFFTTKTEGKGTGLGLSAVYGTIKSHHGALTLQSTPGEGTTFTIYLPLCEQELSAISTTPVSPDKAPHTATVLIIEDEGMLRATARMMLEEHGLASLIAASGEDGVSLYRQHQDEIDLVLLDIIMPGMNGHRTYHELCKINPEVKVIMSSGFVSEERIPDGVSGFIKKPYRSSELISLVNDTLTENKHDK